MAPEHNDLLEVVREIAGMRGEFAAEFRAMREQLEPLKGLPVTVEGQRRDLLALADRVDDLERNDKNRIVFRRVNVPTILISLGLLVVGIAELIHSFS